MATQDLNDLAFFVQVVEHGGFAAAGRALGQPKSKLSRRIALLEARLGVRLIQRSTRRFSVTDIGQTYYQHCKAMLVEAEAAQLAVEQTRAAPCGVVRLSCPIALLHACVSDMLASFMKKYPRVEIQLEATNRRVDVIGEGFDIALRVRSGALEDSELTIKVLAQHTHALVASPALLRREGKIAVPADLSGKPSLAFGVPQQTQVWQLEGPQGARADIRHQPRLVTDDMLTLRAAAIAGLGVLELPKLMLREALHDGSLRQVLPGWASRLHIAHAVYPTKRGQLPSVRALLDHLGARFEHLSDD